MAGATHRIAVDDRLPVWALLFEVAEVVPVDAWALVGGLMVHAHSLRAAVEAPRPTTDVDAVIDATAYRTSEIAGPLQRIGFLPQTPGDGPFHRFVRGRERIDVMVGRDAPRARWAGRPVLRTPGATQALRRRDRYELVGRIARAAVVRVPDSLGAIVAKAVAYEIESRHPERHLEDLAVLLACVGSMSALDLDSLDAVDRRRIRRVLPHLEDPLTSAWVQLDPRASRRGLAIRASLAAYVR